jgi:hypothetical protein
MAFAEAIENDKQAMMVLKKAMVIAKAEKEDIDGCYEISKMVISIAGVLGKFTSQDDQPIDKSEII